MSEEGAQVPDRAACAGGAHGRRRRLPRQGALNGLDERRRFTSGPGSTAEQMVAGVLEQTADWNYVGVSVGVPAPVVDGKSSASRSTSARAGSGSTSKKAFGKPTKVVNDAAMQALGSYDGGRMLFSGSGPVSARR